MEIHGRRLRPGDGLAEHRRKSRIVARSEEHTSELQSPCNLVCRLLLEKKKISELQPIQAVQDLFDPSTPLTAAVASTTTHLCASRDLLRERHYVWPCLDACSSLPTMCR